VVTVALAEYLKHFSSYSNSVHSAVEAFVKICCINSRFTLDYQELRAVPVVWQVFYFHSWPPVCAHSPT